MTIISSEELVRFRGLLGDEAIATLDIVKECGGNLEEAMEIVLVKAGHEPMMGDDDWIDFENIAKEFRGLICNPQFRKFLSDDEFLLALGLLLGETSSYSFAVKTIIFLFIIKRGIDYFCGKEQTKI